MIAAVRIKDVGPLDTNEKTGDIAFVFPDTWVPGTQEPKSFCLIKIPDPINPATGLVWHEGMLQQIRDELLEQVYGPGPTPDSNVVLKARRKAILYVTQRFTQDELDILNNATQALPDGPTAYGGTVSGGIISGLFTLADVLNK